MVRAMMLIDGFGRRVNYLRVSVTDRCNLRCDYCMPVDGATPYITKDILSFEEIVRTVRVANRLGIDRVRITGGEPLLRRDLPELVRMLKHETDLVELAMTTNGLLLGRNADALAASGLDWVNVSLDSLRPDRFQRITHFGVLEKVWAGIRRAAAAGLHPIKINTLILEDFNTDEVDQWVALTVDHDLVVRFLELMPIGEAVRLRSLGGFANLTAIRERLVAQYGLVPSHPGRGNGPARYWKVPGARGMIGFITPVSDRYCDTCSRFRLTSDGDLRPCLAYDDHIALGAAIRHGDEAAIEAGFREAARAKPRGHHWEVGQTTSGLMWKVGG